MGEQLVFIVQGFGLVMAVLALLWLISAILGRIFMARAEPRPATAAPAPAPTPPSGVTAGIPPAHVTAIAAAVAVATGGRGRVVRVVAPAHGAASWVDAGRHQQAQGHRVRTGWNQPSLGAVRAASSSVSQEDARP